MYIYILCVRHSDLANLPRKRKVARPIKHFPVGPNDISYNKQIRQNSCIIRDVISNCQYISTHLKVHANDNIIYRSVYTYKNRPSAKFKVVGDRNIKLLQSFMTDWNNPL